MLGKIFPGFIAAALVLFGTVSARAQINDEVIAAAKREGSVTLYAAFPSAPLYAAVTKSFQAKYGVRVDVLQIRASELHERIRAQQAAGRFLGDVLQASDASTQLRIADRHVGRLGTIPNSRNMVPGMEPTEHRIGAFIGAFGIMVNTNLVKPEDEPKSWTDLLDPRWKGKILLDDPRALGSGHTFFTGLQRLLGTDYHRKFVTNLPVLSRDVGASERRVGLGEFAVVAGVQTTTPPQSVEFEPVEVGVGVAAEWKVGKRGEPLGWCGASGLLLRPAQEPVQVLLVHRNHPSRIWPATALQRQSWQRNRFLTASSRC